VAPFTVAELARKYREHALIYYRKNGRVTREAELVGEALSRAVQLFGDLPAIDFGPACLVDVRESMIKVGWTRGYINKQVGRIKHAFKAAHLYLGRAGVRSVRTVLCRHCG
jgi:hypothetical protein